MRKLTFELHVTLFRDSKTAAWFVVADDGGGIFDLLHDGVSQPSKLPSVAADALGEWLSEQMVD